MMTTAGAGHTPACRRVTWEARVPWCFPSRQCPGVWEMRVHPTWRCKSMMRYRLLRSTMLVFLLLLCLLWRAGTAAPTATTLPIADAVVDPDRTRVPAGKLTIAVHVSLSPKWLNPQENPGAMAYELLWKVHDEMIKPMRGS